MAPVRSRGLINELPPGGGGGKFLGEMMVAADVDDRSTRIGDTVAAEFRGGTWVDDRPLAGDGPLVWCIDTGAIVDRSGVV